MKKVLLINPYETAQDGYSNPPLGLLYLAGTLLRNGIDVRVVDGYREGKGAVVAALNEFMPDMVGITCLTPGRIRVVEIAAMVKEMVGNIPVVLGGAHPTIMYKQMLENYPQIDYIVLGEGEQTLLELVQGADPQQIDGLAYRQDGAVVKTPPRALSKDLDEIPFPAWHLLDLSKYPPRNDGRIGLVNGVDPEVEPRVSVVFSRGCTGHCDFCSTWWIWKGWRHRSAKNMTDELELLYHQQHIRSFCFADDAMTIDRQAVIDLCDEIIDRGLKIAFTITTRTDCVDRVMLDKLKKAGCYVVNFGIETGSSKLLNDMCKENDIETAEKAILLTQEAGLSVTALIIVGNVGETDETVEETARFLKRTKPDNIGSVGGLWILPGTKLYQRCRRKGIIDDDFWLTDVPYPIYTEEHSLQELEGYQKIIARCNRLTRWKRLGMILRYRPLTLPLRLLRFIGRAAAQKI